MWLQITMVWMNLAITTMKSKLKNFDYIEFIKLQPCIFNSSGFVVAHHEAVTTEYKGVHKKWFDYGCLPLSDTLHKKRHSVGFDNFWENKNPRFYAAKYMFKFCNHKNIPTFDFSLFPKEDSEYEQSMFVLNFGQHIHSHI